MRTSSDALRNTRGPTRRWSHEPRARRGASVAVSIGAADGNGDGLLGPRTGQPVKGTDRLARVALGDYRSDQLGVPSWGSAADGVDDKVPVHAEEDDCANDMETGRGGSDRHRVRGCVRCLDGSGRVRRWTRRRVACVLGAARTSGQDRLGSMTGRRPTVAGSPLLLRSP